MTDVGPSGPRWLRLLAGTALGLTLSTAVGGFVGVAGAFTLPPSKPELTLATVHTASGPLSRLYALAEEEGVRTAPAAGQSGSADPNAASLDRLLDRQQEDQVASAQAMDQPAWLWSDGERPLGRAAVLLSLLEKADSHGLDPATYNAHEIRSLLSTFTPDKADALEMMLSRAALRYIQDLGEGAAQPADLARHSVIAPARVDAVRVLREAIETNTMAQLEAKLAPSHPQYAALRAHLETLQAQASTGDFTPIADGSLIRPGGRDRRLPAIIRRMQQMRLLSPEVSALEVYGPEVEAAVRELQRSESLTVDGIIGNQTLRVLNRTPEAKIRAIRASLERWRWMPRDLGNRHLIVNIPEYRVRGYDNGSQTVEMNVVVGRPSRETPMLLTRMTDIAFYPAWHVPASIAVRDLLPRYGYDAHAVSQRFDILSYSGGRASTVSPANVSFSSSTSARSFRYVLRQKPGVNNPLGRLRFGLDNDLAIYLHDTPSRHLFNRPARAHSSGCVRVSEPILLAQYALSKEGGWTPERIAAKYNDTSQAARGTQWVALSEKFPVYLAYFTATVNDAGGLTLHDDIYEEDGLLLNSMLR